MNVESPVVYIATDYQEKARILAKKLCFILLADSQLSQRDIGLIIATACRYS